MQLYFAEGGEPENSAAHRGGNPGRQGRRPPGCGHAKSVRARKTNLRPSPSVSLGEAVSVTFRPDDLHPFGGLIPAVVPVLIVTERRGCRRLWLFRGLSHTLGPASNSPLTVIFTNPRRESVC